MDTKIITAAEFVEWMKGQEWVGECGGLKEWKNRHAPSYQRAVKLGVQREIAEILGWGINGTADNTTLQEFTNKLLSLGLQQEVTESLELSAQGAEDLNSKIEEFIEEYVTANYGGLLDPTSENAVLAPSALYHEGCLYAFLQYLKDATGDKKIEAFIESFSHLDWTMGLREDDDLLNSIIGRECPECGAYHYSDVTRCVECGAEVPEPEEDEID